MEGFSEEKKEISLYTQNSTQPILLMFKSTATRALNSILLQPASTASATAIHTPRALPQPTPQSLRARHKSSIGGNKTTLMMPTHSPTAHSVKVRSS